MYSSNAQIEDKEKYIKAKYDVLEAQKSIRELTSYQKECLFKELFGEEIFRQLISILTSSRSGGY